MPPLLDVHWNNLLLVNYRLKPAAVGLLESELPALTELDAYRGKHYVSVVAFQFQKTRILGVPTPFYRDFAEVNLRFYVRRRMKAGWRRGVVFVKELVPCRFPAWVANWVFKENFHIRPVRCEATGKRLAYRWSDGGEEQRLESGRLTEWEEPGRGSLAEHIIDHYWAYKKTGATTTGEFRVHHRPWRIQSCPAPRVRLDIARVYGAQWASALTYANTFCADGSRVQVTKPTEIKR